MFENVGYSLKMLAKIIFATGIAASLVIGGMLIAQGMGYELMAIIIIISGVLCSYMSSLLLYGFGELLELVKSLTGGKAVTSSPKVSGVVKSVVNRVKITNSDAIVNTATCDLCQKSDNTLRPARYTDAVGTRYIKVCPECFKNYNCEDLA
ncbi:MAG: hypothetical protein J6D26_07100 [Clostridia bacterium]|nr:hypothetical protein [Clostridia bacterium]